MLKIAMTDVDVLERFQAVMGYGMVKGPYRPSGKNTPSSYKDIYYWQANGIRNVFGTLRKMYPYLGERRRKRAAEVVALYYLNKIK